MEGHLFFNPGSLLYKILIFPARIALHFYCKKIKINDPELLSLRGPLVIAANHPNSFLDAILIDSLFTQPVYSLARGDAFVSPLVRKLFRSFNMLPVYRISEGAENLVNNYDTFDEVQKLLKENKIVLIFSEGRCENEWHLRPLKKGTARIAFSAWDAGIPLRVLPTGINYSNFRHLGKTVIINFGELLRKEDFLEKASQGKLIGAFNEKLKSELSDLVYEIGQKDVKKKKDIFEKEQSFISRILLALPAAIGFVLHAPLYYAIKLIIKDKAIGHYDSIMVGSLFLFYPLYVIVFTLIVFLVTNLSITFLLAAIFPLTALCLLHFRSSVQH